MNKYYVYTLLSLKDRRFYVGFTANLKNRLQQHAHQDAKAREVFLKSGFGRNQMKQALKQTLL
ncbi:MAG: GIY-YIG nuclease family protein [Candidatus Yanofskybacteria bacterium]|nr:GIY-YIG nuclease family protein [Candidatus Yanofskybacteria bacterium]